MSFKGPPLEMIRYFFPSVPSVTGEQLLPVLNRKRDESTDVHHYCGIEFKLLCRQL